MINWIKEFFAPPTFAEEDKTRVARLLYMVSKIGLAGAVILVFLFAFVTRDFGIRLISTSIAIPILFFEMALVKKGYVRFAAFFVVVTTWIGGNYITMYTGGVRDVGFGINLIVVLEAGMLISLGAALVFGALSSLVGFGMAIAQTQGLMLPFTSESNAFAAWTTQSLYLGLMAGLLYVTVSYLQQSLARTKSAEAHLRGIIENTPDIILETDRAGIITLINHYQDLYLGKQVRELIHADDIPNVNRAIELAFTTGETSSLEVQSYAPDSTLAWDSVRVGSIAQEGKVTSLAVIITDITERKQAEKETQRRLNEFATVNAISQVTASQIELDALTQLTGEKLRQVLNVHGVFIALYDPKSNIISFPYWRVRDRVMQVPSFPFGQGLISWVIRSRQPLVINNDYVRRSTELGLVRPALPQEAGNTPKAWLGVPMQVGEQVIGMIGAQNYEQEDAFSESDIRLWMTIAANVGIAIQNAQLYSATQQELAERKQAEQEREILQHLALELTAPLTLKELVKLLAMHCRQLFLYDSFRFDLYDKQEQLRSPVYAEDTPAEGQTPVDVETESEAQKPGIIRTVFDGKQVLVNRKPGMITDGLTPWGFASRRSQSMMFIPVRWHGGCIGVVYVQSYTPERYNDRDLMLLQMVADQCGAALARVQADAERENLIQELTTKNAELERFTYAVSHDLKSPLVTIRGFLGFIEQDTQSGNMNRLKADMQRISDATDKMLRLLNELLELSRIGRMMSAPEIIPFADLVRDAMDNVHGQLEAGRVTVILQPNLPAVHGDRQRLVQVLQNMLDNAAKFMGDQPNPRIEIGQRGTDADGKPILFVRDNGLGIEPQYHERVFGLFNKLDAQTEGTGVGLALVKRIVEVHGGRIWVESEPGRGATFCFTLPRPERPAAF